MLESLAKYHESHQSTEYNMVVRLKASSLDVHLSLDSGVTAQIQSLGSTFSSKDKIYKLILIYIIMKK